MAEVGAVCKIGESSPPPPESSPFASISVYSFLLCPSLLLSLPFRCLANCECGADCKCGDACKGDCCCVCICKGCDGSVCSCGDSCKCSRVQECCKCTKCGKFSPPFLPPSSPSSLSLLSPSFLLLPPSPSCDAH